MANWQRRLDIKPIWKKAAAGKAKPWQVAKAIAAQLAKMEPLGHADLDDTRESLAEDFAHFAQEKSLDSEDFDVSMENLFDWADTSLDGCFNGKKVCWVRTF